MRARSAHPFTQGKMKKALQRVSRSACMCEGLRDATTAHRGRCAGLRKMRGHFTRAGSRLQIADSRCARGIQGIAPQRLPPLQGWGSGACIHTRRRCHLPRYVVNLPCRTRCMPAVSNLRPPSWPHTTVRGVVCAALHRSLALDENRIHAIRHFTTTRQGMPGGHPRSRPHRDPGFRAPLGRPATGQRHHRAGRDFRCGGTA